MQSQEKFHLESNDFRNKLNQHLRDLRNDTDFCDITLVSDDNEQIQAHKVILATFSTFFDNILKQNKHPHPLIIMKEIKCNELVAILDFLYFGEVQVSQNDLANFFKAAEGLQIEGLEDEEEESTEIETAVKEYNQHCQEKPDTNKQEEVTRDLLGEVQQQPLLEEDQGQYKVETDSQQLSSISQVQSNNVDFQTQLVSKMEKVYGGWRCAVCSKDEINLVLRKDDMEDHVEAKHLEKQFQVMWKCETCDKIHKTRTGLRNHVGKRHKQVSYKSQAEIGEIKEIKLQINPANVDGNETGDLSDYTKITHVIDEQIEPMIEKYGIKQWICKICGKIANCKTNIKCHVEANHLKRGSYLCPECGKNIQSRNGLWTHISRFHRQYLLDNVSRKKRKKKLL